MDNNGKNTNQTRENFRRVHFVKEWKKFKMHKIDWCEGGLQF